MFVAYFINYRTLSTRLNGFIDLSLFYFFLSKKRKELIYNKYIYFLLFYVVLILSSLLSDYKLLSLKTSVAYIRFGTLILIIAYLITVKKNILNLFFYILIFLFILLFMNSLFQKFYRRNIFGFAHPIHRITSFFGKDIKLGGYVARLTPLIIALAVYNKVRFFNIIVLLTISLLITGISGERTAFGMIVLFTIGFVIFQKLILKIKYYFYFLLF